MATPGKTSEASQRISDKIAGLDDWRGQTMARLRRAVLKADPQIEEQWKWNTPVWAHDGLVCSTAAFKTNVKLTFFKGASLAGGAGLFNSGLDAKEMRSMDFREGDDVDETAVADLVRAAVALNGDG